MLYSGVKSVLRYGLVSKHTSFIAVDERNVDAMDVGSGSDEDQDNAPPLRNVPR